MRNFAIFMCTIMFVLVSACQDQSGFVQDVRPITGVQSSYDLNPVEAIDVSPETVREDVPLARLFRHLLEIGHTEALSLLENPTPSAYDESFSVEKQVINLLLTHSEMDQLIAEINTMVARMNAEKGQEYTQNVLKGTVDLFQKSLIESFDVIETRIGTPCFDALQIAQAQAYVIFAGCVAVTVETIVGLPICAAILLVTQAINYKEFKDCIGRY